MTGTRGKAQNRGQRRPWLGKAAKPDSKSTQGPVLSYGVSAFLSSLTSAGGLSGICRHQVLYFVVEGQPFSVCGPVFWATYCSLGIHYVLAPVWVFKRSGYLHPGLFGRPVGQRVISSSVERERVSYDSDTRLEGLGLIPNLEKSELEAEWNDPAHIGCNSCCSGLSEDDCRSQAVRIIIRPSWGS